jgi:3-methylcrotonyl-CoA carboxylase alpha subunit
MSLLPIFESMLIANRGEIACRIIQTCRRLGIRSIAVYSDADANALHVKEADTAICIGPAEATLSYLNAQVIMDAALSSGAKAIHPGYGFLSEKTVLPLLCQQHGIVWVGPRADVIEKMGSKIESKRIAEKAGVMCVPGYHGENQDAVHLLEQAKIIGWPILIKASAGGGGKGMRKVLHENEFISQLTLAKQEAIRSFGDDRILIEKLIALPRHLEVQIAGDKHNHLIHLFERECSIQRNYQKLIEEAPAPNLSALVRSRLFDFATKLGKAIGYDSLGTVEFVLDEGSDTPYFLEMNTRLQVEHPVTEIVTGIDLVELQIRIASGQPLGLVQDEIHVNGWAIEARINCENPSMDYRPELGTVIEYTEPKFNGIRVDSGITTGTNITPYYDSMVAKLIGSGLTRSLAADRLMEGLSALHVTGIGTNQAFLAAIIDHPLFRTGRLSTSFLSQAFGDEGWKPKHSLHAWARIIAAINKLKVPTSHDSQNPWHQASGFRTMAGAGRTSEAVIQVSEGTKQAEIRLKRTSAHWLVSMDDQDFRVSHQILSPSLFRLTPEYGHPTNWWVNTEPDQECITVGHNGMRWQFKVLHIIDALSLVAADGSIDIGENSVTAVMPGLITAIQVNEGQQVESGDTVVVMEAMKLIFNLNASCRGRVQKILCKPGDVVSVGQVVLEIAASATVSVQNCTE